MTDSINYDIFISYARADNATGWVTALRDAIYEDFAKFPEPLRIFLDQEEIRAGARLEDPLGSGATHVTRPAGVPIAELSAQ